MDLIDRLISGAGAVADAADRFAGLFGRAGGSGRASFGAAVVAAGLGGLAVLFLLVGVEGSDRSAPRPVGAGVGDTAAYGDHAFVTVSGQVASEYGGHFVDDDGNGTQDPGEPDADFVYVVRDPATEAGVAVVSARAPAEVYRAVRVGRVQEDPSYIAEDLPYVQKEVADLGITLDRTRYVDARGSGVAAPEAIHLADQLPEPGTPVSFDDGIVATWTYLCPTDADCAESEAASYDALVYDPVSKRGIIVVTDQSPEWTPATFTGMLRREEHAVSEALDPAIFDLDAMGVSVSQRYLLDDGMSPVDPLIAWVLAAICGSLAGLIVIGLAGDFLVFRRERGGIPMSGAAAPLDGTAGLPIDASIPLRVSGWLQSPSGLVRVREAPADLRRYATAVLPEPASTLIVQRRGRPDGVVVGIGHLRRMSRGDVFPLRGRRPALRLTVGTGPLLLSFDAAADRDRAAVELSEEVGLPPSPPSPPSSPTQEA